MVDKFIREFYGDNYDGGTVFRSPWKIATIAFIVFFVVIGTISLASAQEVECYTHEAVMELNGGTEEMTLEEKEAAAGYIRSLTEEEVQNLKDYLDSNGMSRAEFSSADLLTHPNGADWVFVVLYDEDGCGVVATSTLRSVFEEMIGGSIENS